MILAVVGVLCKETATTGMYPYGHSLALQDARQIYGGVFTKTGMSLWVLMNGTNRISRPLKETPVSHNDCSEVAITKGSSVAAPGIITPTRRPLASGFGTPDLSP